MTVPTLVLQTHESTNARAHGPVVHMLHRIGLSGSIH